MRNTGSGILGNHEFRACRTFSSPNGAGTCALLFWFDIFSWKENQCVVRLFYFLPESFLEIVHFPVV